MLAAIHRGRVSDRSQLAHSPVANETAWLQAELDEALSIAESSGIAAAVRGAARRLRRTPREIALDRFRDAFGRTRLTTTWVAAERGTS